MEVAFTDPVSMEWAKIVLKIQRWLMKFGYPMGPWSSGWPCANKSFPAFSQHESLFHW